MTRDTVKVKVKVTLSGISASMLGCLRGINVKFNKSLFSIGNKHYTGKISKFNEKLLNSSSKDYAEGESARKALRQKDASAKMFHEYETERIKPYVKQRRRLYESKEFVRAIR
jgi:hypothetical protein